MLSQGLAGGGEPDRERGRKESGPVGARRPRGVLRGSKKNMSPKVSQVWSAAIRHGERSASTKGPCLLRFRLQMTWKDAVVVKGEPVFDDSVSSAVRVSRRLPWNTSRPSTRRRFLEGHDDSRQREAGGEGANRSATVFARQETAPAAGEYVIFHSLAHATSPAIKKKKKKGRQPSPLVVPPSYSSVALPGANDFQRAPNSTDHAREGVEKNCAVVVTVTRACDAL